ncbi:MAG: SGNH/GDSL hydrolase family protein [Solirubrobacteraceae bacterium]|nr:SGNH/GDSL hydrolase family protein [Solirubrobacteraceae bacterium]
MTAAVLEAADPRCLSADEAAALLRDAPWRRVVALGDSIIEGLGAHDGSYRRRAWIDRVFDAMGDISAARNLGMRDLLAAEIRARQLGSALAFAPDLALVSAGGNDILRPELDLDRVEAELDTIVGALRATGADVVTLGMFDASGSPYVPEEFRAPLTRRIHRLSERTAAVAARHGAIHVDCTNHAAGADPAIYSPDGLHCSSEGHAIAASEAIRVLSARVRARAAP